MVKFDVLKDGEKFVLAGIKVLDFIKKLFYKQFNNFTSIEFGMLCVGARFWFGGVEFIKISSNKLSYTNACQYNLSDEETVFGETEIVYVKREN
jgi:hypothetical protein